jgi:hypothetical protein
MKKILFFMVAVMALAACENDAFYYRDVPRVRLEGPSAWTLGEGADSISYNFIYAGLDAQSYPMQITLIIMGNIAPHQRTARLEVTADKTTAAASQYDIPSSVVIPAGKDRVVFPVTLRREGLGTATVRLRFGVVASDDFLPGVDEQHELLIKWNDMVDKPNNWDDELDDFFGAYSDVKMRFIIEQTGVTDFSGLTWAQRFFMQVELNAKLQEYNAANGILLDENNAPVTFPQ